ncbi:MAG: hypothetical protein KF718_03065 [Polyangiaceae bacterium]|nr:hypothetical protein [Polyangiaceae bacterium]
MRSLPWACAALLLASCNSASDPERRPIPSPGWGAGNGQIARDVPDEGAPIGARSFVVGADGRVHILDQVSARVVRFEGSSAKGAVKLPARPFEDLALLEGGGYALLDPFASRAVVFVDAQGSEQSKIELSPLGVEPGRVTALDADESGVWVEVDGSYRVRIGDATGAVAPPQAEPGTARAGQWLYEATRSPGGPVTVARRPAAGGPKANLASVALSSAPIDFRLLASQQAPELYLAVRFGVSTDVGGAESITLVVLHAETGAELRRRELGGSSSVEESFRWVRLSPSGSLRWLTVDAKGVQVREVAP